MKKRILSILTALVLCLTLLPTAAWAEEPVYTSLSSDTFEEWNGQGDTPTGPYKKKDFVGYDYHLPGGHYRLTADISGIPIQVDDTVTLDLNGHTLDGTNNTALIVGGWLPAYLTLKDSSTAQTGKVSGSDFFVIIKNGSLTLESGTVEGSGTAIYAQSGATVTLKGGTVSASSGAAVHLELTYDGQSVPTLNADGGTVNGSVINNRGIITRSSDSVTATTTFTGTVQNGGTIAWGTYSGTVEGTYDYSEDIYLGTLSGGTFKGEIVTYKTTGETVQDFLADGYGYRYYDGDTELDEWYQAETTSVTPTDGKSICVEKAPFEAAGITPATYSLTYGYDDVTSFTATTTGNIGRGEQLTYQWYLGTEQNTLFTDGNTAGGNSGFFNFPTGKTVGTYYVGCAITVKGYTLKSNIVTVTVSKATPTIAVSITGWTYGDNANAPTVTGVTDTDTVTYEYKLKTANNDAYSATVPTAAGKYTVRATVAETATLAAASDTADFTIAPKPATITALDKTGRVYDLAPDLSSPVVDKDYTIEGIVEDDTVAVTLTCDADMSRIGEYAIVPSATDPNYAFTFVPGKLTLTYQPIVLPTTYAVTAPETEHGTVKVSPRYAERGDTVTVTVTPDSGFTLETLTVLDRNGKEIELTDKGDGTYSFKMPSGKVEVKATFAEDNSMLNFFVDVTADQYYYDAVLWAAKNGITGGVDENHFGPDLSCTRAQLVTFLWRAAGCPVVNYAMDFSDVGDDYYTEAVRWAASLGIVGGYGNGLFGSNDTITREQMATILYRFAQTQGNGFSGAWAFRLNFEDVSELSDWAVEGVSWCVMNDIMQGYDNNLMPKAECTRAQIVTMLYRLLGA